MEKFYIRVIRENVCLNRLGRLFFVQNLINHKKIINDLLRYT